MSPLKQKTSGRYGVVTLNPKTDREPMDPRAKSEIAGIRPVIDGQDVYNRTSRRPERVQG